MNEVRVLNVLGSLDVGGTEVRLLGLMPQQLEAGVTHDFLCLSGNRGSLAPSFEKFGCTVFPVRLNAIAVWRIFVLLRSKKYDFIHSRVATFSGFILAIAFIAGVSGRIAHFHSDEDEHFGGVRRVLQRYIGRVLIRMFATHVLAVSPEAMRFSGTDPLLTRKRTQLIPGGVSIPNDSVLMRSFHMPSRNKRVFNIGRPAPAKRREFAASVVEACGSSYSIEFIGKRGPDLDRVVQRARDHGHRPPVLHGVRNDVQDILADCDCLLSTSLVEGLPGVVLEALSVGTPVVTSNLSGARWIAEHIGGVFLVDVDAPEAIWASEVRKACESSIEVRKLIARDFAASPFTLSSASAALISIYGLSK